MGCYINPTNMTKENWLAKNGTRVEAPVLPRDGDDFELVCLLNNYTFTAAAVCFDKGELDMFSNVTDPRPRVWFQVPRDKLLAACPDAGTRPEIMARKDLCKS